MQGCSAADAAAATRHSTSASTKRSHAPTTPGTLMYLNSALTALCTLIAPVSASTKRSHAPTTPGTLMYLNSALTAP
jgi:hypothetical protein